MLKQIIFLFFLVDFIVSKRLSVPRISLIQTKIKSLRDEELFNITGHQLFQNQEIKFMIPRNWTNYTDNEIMYFHPTEISPEEGVLSVRRVLLPPNIENRIDFFIGTLQKTTNNSLDYFMPYPIDNFTIGGFDGYRYFFNKPYQNGTFWDGYVATLVKANNTLYIIYALYQRQHQAKFRRGVDTIIATFQHGEAPTEDISQFSNDLYGCWLKIDIENDYFSGYRIFTNFNFTRENNYNMLIEEYTSIFGDLKMTAEYGQNGKYLVEGNVITLLDPRNNANIMTFNKYNNGLLIDGSYYTRC